MVFLEWVEPREKSDRHRNAMGEGGGCEREACALKGVSLGFQPHPSYVGHGESPQANLDFVSSI